MGNKNSNIQNKKLFDNKNEFKFILTRNYICDISLFYDYEKKYESINYKSEKYKKINNNYIYIICGLIDGFIEIYGNGLKGEFKLSLSFQAHRELVSKIIQLKNSGNLLTCSFDNSFKVFKLSKNCTRETLIYKIYLNPIFNRINDTIQIKNDDNLLISVFNYIIYFPYNKNNLSENKNNLSDYVHSKYEHGKKFLSNLLEVNDELFLAFDDIENKLLFFKLIPSDNIAKNIILIKSFFIVFEEEIKNKEINKKIYIENLLPKYNLILLSIYNYIKIIDIKYLEVICIQEMKMASFFFSYNNYIDRIMIFKGNKIYKYKIDNWRNDFYFYEEKKKRFELKNKDEFNKIEKLVYNPLNTNKIYFFYKKYLINIELFFDEN